MINLIKVLNLLNKPIKWLQNIKFRSKINSKFNANECYGGSAFFLFFWKKQTNRKNTLKHIFFLFWKKQKKNKNKNKNKKHKNVLYFFTHIFKIFSLLFFSIRSSYFFKEKKQKINKIKIDPAPIICYI